MCFIFEPRKSIKQQIAEKKSGMSDVKIFGSRCNSMCDSDDWTSMLLLLTNQATEISSAQAVFDRQKCSFFHARTSVNLVIFANQESK